MKHDNTKMPDSVHEVFGWLEDELIWIHEKWNAYHALFASGQEPIDLLNSLAPHFFAMVQEILAHDVFVALSRLDDPPGPPSRKREQNLSLERLINTVREAGNEDLTKELEAHHRVARAAIKPLKRYRNKRLGHNDLKACLGTENVLPSVTRRDVDNALDAAAKLLGEVPLYYDKTDVAFWTVGPDLGPRELLWQIKRWRQQDA